MSLEKAKKGVPKRNKFIFLVLWLIGHLLAWGAFYPITEWFGYTVEGIPLYVMAGLIVGGITSLVQYGLIRWQFGRNIKSWVPLSVAAWIFALLVPFRYTIDTLGFSQFDVAIQAFALYAPAVLVQTVLLRRHVRQSWLWLLACVAGTSTFALSVASLDGGMGSVLLGYGVYASATALTLLWLFGMSGQHAPQMATNSVETGHRLTEVEDPDHTDYGDVQETAVERRTRQLR